jgi:DNA mismatch endonuclease, patch repair protein
MEGKEMDQFTKNKRSLIMAQVRSAGNKSTEMKLVWMLRKEKITGWRRCYPIFGKPDFVFQQKKVAVFVDGCFWHGHPKKCRMPKTNRRYWTDKIRRNMERDKLVTHTLKAKGWKVVRIWEDSINKSATLVRLRKALA